MTPGDPALALHDPAPDAAAVPDYVQALERAAYYLDDAQRAQLRRAWAIGAAAHAGQTRKSGEPYITHPVAVSQVLAELGLDLETLVAATLHDTIEDTPLTRADVAAQFGETVAELVDGVTKLEKVRFADKQEAAAESFRKMLLAMSRDLRVIMIKLADRLHNMRTLGAKSPDARRRIAVETLEIYAPIAQRLGMNLVKAELQDLGFKALHPWRHAVIAKRIRSQPLVRREALVQIEARLAQRLALEKLEHRLVGRVKTPWSVYTKMRAQSRSFAQVMDVFGFRVVVDTVADCYHALGVVHAVYKPLDGRFRDFIAIPKANGYQSLHTVLFGPYGSPIEVQIRTREMDLIAERGVAAHWAYKIGVDGGGNSAQSRAAAWIANLVETQRGTGSSLEFLENVKVDLFPDEVYLFTPKGDILSLPRNSTALDFAYAVHTDVGNHAVTARVDRRLAPLRTKLVSGQSVEIITAKSAVPTTQWLEFVATSKARTAIRQQLKQLEHEDAVQLGHYMLDRALGAHALAGGAGTGAAAERRGPAGRRRAAGAHPHHRRRARGDQLCAVLPADPARRDHGLPQRRQGHRGPPDGVPEPRRAAQVAGALGGDWLGPRGVRRFQLGDPHRGGEPPGRAGAGGGGDRQCRLQHRPGGVPGARQQHRRAAFRHRRHRRTPPGRGHPRRAPAAGGAGRAALLKRRRVEPGWAALRSALQ